MPKASPHNEINPGLAPSAAAAAAPCPLTLSDGSISHSFCGSRMTAAHLFACLPKLTLVGRFIDLVAAGAALALCHCISPIITGRQSYSRYGNWHKAVHWESFFAFKVRVTIRPSVDQSVLRWPPSAPAAAPTVQSLAYPSPNASFQRSKTKALLPPHAARNVAAQM